jgi:dTDP-4-dehydrorhamnose 3,5-epimerase
MKFVDIKDLQVHQDDRGDLYEVVHDYDIEEFGQVYVVHDRTKDIVRAFHRHEKLWDYFCIVKGSAKFAFSDSADPDAEVETVTITERQPKLITVPPTIFHGWQSLEDDTVLLSTGSETYNQENPDEERIAWDTYGKDVWEMTKK